MKNNSIEYLFEPIIVEFSRFVISATPSILTISSVPPRSKSAVGSRFGDIQIIVKLKVRMFDQIDDTHIVTKMRITYRVRL